ncbi:MAG TPA: hypothetical protein VN231_15205 [Allosphingosinicella sp.]|nr:hypothetical protein [Allosphingosinicella sp.]
MRPLILLLTVAGCASLSESGQVRLSRELAGLVAGEPRACVSANQGSSLQAADNRTIVYRTQDIVWVSRLPGECPGLTPLSTLVVESFSGQYCRGDRVRGLEPGRSIAGPSCPLADFVPYRRP